MCQIRQYKQIDFNKTIQKKQDFNKQLSCEEEGFQQPDYRSAGDYQQYSAFSDEFSNCRNSDHSIDPGNYHEQDLNGPINRQIRIYVKTVSERMEEFPSSESVYKDNITRCNANARCRKLGVPVCYRFCYLLILKYISM